MILKTLKNTTLDLKNKKILLRVAFDIKPERGILQDTSRIEANISTIKYLLNQNATIFILTWVGRPKNKDQNLSTVFHAKALEKILKHKVTHLPDCFGPKIQKAIKESKPGEIYMLENVRFHKEENPKSLTLKGAPNPEEYRGGSDPNGNPKKNFARQLSQGYDALIFDAFPQAHRNTPSTTGIQKYLKTITGFSVEKETKNLSNLLNRPQKPFTIIIGGAKISDKLSVVKNLINKADNILIGGAAANPLLAFNGLDIQNSLTEKIKKPVWLNSKKVHLPKDYIIKNKKILDIGPQTIKKWQKIIKNSKTILWSGPLGLYEQKKFSTGTKKIAQNIIKSKAKSIIGGGDTISAINKLSHLKKFTHTSLAGGAMLEFLSGKTLPALKKITSSKSQTNSQ
jgi:phosphoglycerate kinase